MAKAREITGLDCEANAIECAAKILRVRFEEVLEFRGAALDSEGIEGVHDMRVATRRLRSALRDFAHMLKRNSLKKISKDIKQIADTLGAARDQDVAIVALKKLRKKSKDKQVKAGIAKLIEDRRAIREQAQLDLMETLAVSNMEILQKSFEKTVDAATRQKTSARVITFNEAGRTVVGKSLEEFCDLSENIYEPFVDKPLHKLRIAAKRLRYAVELYTTCWGAPLAPFADSIAEMQGFLGEVHDADVWLESLSERLRKADENAANIWLLSEFVEKRTKNYRAALNLWSEWQKNDFINKMRIVILQQAS